MLDSLDTLIAFVTILTICSMFVLIIVQMISSALSLRGKNMANALAITFQTISPGLSKDAYRLAQRILSDPLLSDSMIPVKNRATTTKATITVTRDAPWTFLGGTKEAMSLANAIRPEEIYAALKKLAADPDSTIQSAATTLVTAIDDVNPQAEEIKTKLTALADVAVQLTAAVADPATKTEISKRISEASGEIVRQIDTGRERLAKWFSAAQDRSEQWFRANTRGVTIAVSVLFALICQIDAIEIFQLVSSSPDARKALVGAGAQVLKAGDGVLPDATGGEARGGLPRWVADRWNAEFKGLELSADEAKNAVHVADVRLAAQKKATAEAVAQALQKQAALRDAAVKKATAAATDLKGSPADEEKKKADAKAGTELEAAEARLAALKDFDFNKDFDRIEGTAFAAYQKAVAARLKSLQSLTAAAGFQIIPETGWRWSYKPDDPLSKTGCSPQDGNDRKCGFWKTLWNYRHLAVPHLPGMILFAGLLTLGAPYWFNLLKNLASLRPALAQLIGEEKTAAQAKPPP